MEVLPPPVDIAARFLRVGVAVLVRAEAAVCYLELEAFKVQLIASFGVLLEVAAPAHLPEIAQAQRGLVGDQEEETATQPVEGLDPVATVVTPPVPRRRRTLGFFADLEEVTRLPMTDVLFLEKFTPDSANFKGLVAQRVEFCPDIFPVGTCLGQPTHGNEILTDRAQGRSRGLGVLVATYSVATQIPV